MNPRKFFVGRIVGLAVVAVLVVGFFAFNSFIYTEKQDDSVAPKDYKNTTYIIEGNEVHLIDGVSEAEAAPGSATKVTTRYFGNVGKGDFNADGIPDLAFILTQDTGGSGLFYYVVAALQTADGSYVGTNAVLLGDRIAPQTTEVHGNEIVVNYAERRAGEPMTTAPSVGTSVYLKVSDTQLIKVAQ